MMNAFDLAIASPASLEVGNLVASLRHPVIEERPQVAVLESVRPVVEEQAPQTPVAEAIEVEAAVRNHRLDFHFDKATGRMVMEIYNRQTGDVERQVPPEELLRLAARLHEMVGVMVDRVA